MLSKFDYFKPKSIEEALEYLEKNDGTKILAGGTDLMILLRRNAVICNHILDIKGIPETKNIDYTQEEGLFIGASVNINQIAKSDIIREKYTSLSQAASSVASYQLRNRATLVGNICNASPGGDLAAPLLIFNSRVHITGPNGKRIVDIKDFFTGVKRTVLEKNEIVLGVQIPYIEKEEVSVYLKQSRLKGHDLATVGVAARLNNNKEVLLAIAAVAPTPIRLTKLEEIINSKELSSDLAIWASEELANHISPISDVRSSKEYRIHISSILLKKALLMLVEKGVN
jgi:carbon-monoxide dehydrogenase medium subunit